MAMKHVVLMIAIIMALVEHSPATTDSCKAMGLYFCTECEDPDLQCYLCISGYTLKADKSGCLKCTDPNCQQCSINIADTTKADCEVCAAGFYLNDADKTCVSCGINNCNTCHMGNDSVVVCDQCDSSYYKVSDSECAACDTSCLNCTSTSCLACKSPSNVVSGADLKTCAACPDNCKTCITGNSTTITKCTTCNDGYYVSNGACAACSAGDCKTCPDDKCNVCIDNFYIDGTSCAECSYQCSKCSDGITCDTCVDGYTTKGAEDKSCDECPANCIECTLEEAAQGTCTKCAESYALDSSTNKCVACNEVANCQTCDSTDGVVVCTKCEANFVEQENTCYECPDNCEPDSCIYNDMAFDGFKTYCEYCNEGYTMGNVTKCAQCKGCDYCGWNDEHNAVQSQCSVPSMVPTESEYYKYRGYCSDSDTTPVYVCQEGYYYVEQDPVTQVPSCIACIDGCTYCNNTDYCIECDLEHGYAEQLKNDGSCYKCSTISEYCTECSSADGEVFQCDNCKSGSFLTDNGCSACLTYCDDCVDASSCTTCKAGTIKGTAETCYSCPASCTTCTVDTDGVTSCTTCVDGYEVNNGACEACPANCLDCEYVDDSLICSDGKCATGYQKWSSDKLCHACPNNCATCTESSTTSNQLVCVTCRSQFTLNSYTCGACPTNCAKCSTKDANIICDTCDAGYYKDSDNACQKCFTDCATCTSGTTCTKCVIGKGMPEDKSTCTDCATLTEVLNCDTCVDASSDTPSKCVSCETDFTIAQDGSKCLSVTSFGNECLEALDKPPSCSACQEGVGAELVYDKCLVNCFTCGNLTNNVPTSTVTQCNAQGKEYPDKAQCEYGCYIGVKYENSQMTFASRGCAQNSNCLSDEVEQCSNSGASQNCLRCCDSEELCNGDYWDPSSAPASHVIGITTILIALLVVYVIN